MVVVVVVMKGLRRLWGEQEENNSVKADTTVLSVFYLFPLVAQRGGTGLWEVTKSLLINHSLLQIAHCNVTAIFASTWILRRRVLSQCEEQNNWVRGTEDTSPRSKNYASIDYLVRSPILIFGIVA